MQKKFLLALLFGALIALASLPSIRAEDDSGNDSGCNADSKGSSSGDCKGDSTESQDAGSAEKSNEKRKEKEKELTDGAPQNNGNCKLIDGLNVILATLTGEHYTIFEQFIVKLKGKLAISVDISEVSVSFLDFQAEYSEVWAEVQYQNITGWGVLAKYSKIVGISLSETISTTVVLDASESSPLIEAFLTFSQEEGLKAAAQDFVDKELRPLLKTTTLVGKKKVIAIGKLIKEFIGRNPSYEGFKKAKIPGWGILKKYLYISTEFNNMRWVKSVFRGSASENVLVVQLKKKHQELVAAGELSIAVQFQNVIEQVELEFTSITSFRGRLAFFIKIVREQGRLNWGILKKFYSVYLTGFGNIFDLISSGSYFLVEPLTAATTSTSCSCSCTTPSL